MIKRGIIAGVIFFAAIVLTLGIFLFNSSNDTGGDSRISPGDLNDLEGDSEFGEELLPPSDISGTGGSSGGSGSGGSGGSSSGGGGSGGDTGGSTGSQGQTSYSVSPIVVSSVCDQFSGSTCVEKTTFCSVNVRNLNENIGKTFEVTIRFVDSINSETFYSDSSSSGIGPLSSEIFSQTYNIVSSGEEGIANKEITCVYGASQQS